VKPRICLVVERSDGHRSEAEIEGAPVTSDMLDSAEDLLHTLTTGERPVIKNLYDLVARAFSTTREDAKERIAAAANGMPAWKIDRRNRPAATQRDQRRIADGNRALALPDPQSPDEIRDQLTIIHDGMLSLQSLDDLGEEGNRAAHENLRELERRYEALKARLRSAKR
jgi:hypothetical protein